VFRNSAITSHSGDSGATLLKLEMARVWKVAGCGTAEVWLLEKLHVGSAFNLGLWQSQIGSSHSQCGALQVVTSVGASQ
jgi:hypothetical protein